jgi:hypothetical protein
MELRFTEKEAKFRKLMQFGVPQETNRPEDENPLFSSFSKDKIFVPPMSSKDALKQCAVKKENSKI